MAKNDNTAKPPRKEPYKVGALLVWEWYCVVCRSRNAISTKPDRTTLLVPSVAHCCKCSQAHAFKE